MRLTEKEARRLLQQTGLRATAPRLAVLRVLAAAKNPLSHSEVLAEIGNSDWDQATIYRNLVRLRDAGIAPVVSRAAGVDRYAFAHSEADQHQHPHFICDYCGKVECLPADLTGSLAVPGRWETSVRTAMIELRGECPECLARSERPAGSGGVDPSL